MFETFGCPTIFWLPDGGAQLSYAYPPPLFSSPFHCYNNKTSVVHIGTMGSALASVDITTTHPRPPPDPPSAYHSPPQLCYNNNTDAGPIYLMSTVPVSTLAPLTSPPSDKSDTTDIHAVIFIIIFIIITRLSTQ